MSEADPRRQAAEYFHRAYEKQMAGDYDEAIELYSRSIAAFPTAEAYTFRGWTYSFKGDLDRAIAECLEAIKVDPDFGNPYNDIGAYLIEMGRLEEAIPWLEKATHAPRYEAHCFPHFNLGRVYERKHEWKKAADCYRRAHDLNSGYTVAAVALKRLQTMWN
ncbi:MAG: tetratricopeptide repeat protein [Terriglobales bacterium]